MRVVAVLAVLLAVQASATTVTPVGKVIELLSKLQKQVEDEGKKEAAQYDKFACFCKDQASEKIYLREKWTEKIANLDSDIEYFDGEMTNLNSEISEKNERIDVLADDMEKAEKTRGEENDTFQKLHDDLERAVNQIKGATKAIKDSTTQMKDTNFMGSKAALISQTYNVVAESLVFGNDMSLSPAEQHTLESFLQQAPGKAPAYKFHSNDILNLLNKLYQTFKEKLQTAIDEEATKRHAFEKAQSARSREKTTLDEAVEEAKAQVAKLSEQKQNAETLKTTTELDKSDNENFLKELTEECESRAQDWDDRSTTRTGELAAIAEAMEQLKGGVQQNYGTNKKLVGLVVRKAAPVRRLALVDPVEAAEPVSTSDDDGEDMDYAVESNTDETGGDALDPDFDLDYNPPGNFLQLPTTKSTRQALKLLASRAKELHSEKLGLLVTKASADPFKKVRDLIDDLVARLKKEAQEEADEKDFCDKQMTAATEQKEEAESNIQETASKIATAKTTIATTKSENKFNNEEIARLTADSAEATELRKEESNQNKVTVAEAKAGFEAVSKALKVLSDFYSENAPGLAEGGSSPTAVSFIQQPDDYVTRDMTHVGNADSKGNTVKDLAPEMYDKGYHGSQKESKGVIGILEVIKSDFDRTLKKTESDEEAAEKIFTGEEKKRQDEIERLQGEVKKGSELIVKTEAELAGLEEDQNSYKKQLATAQKKLGELKGRCVDSGEDFKERAAKREQEVESLKEALAILNSVDVNIG